LPLSVVVHIDYQKAPNVIQRFGDVHKLITQTIDPMLSAYFRDVAHKNTMLELIHNRDEIQVHAREELSKKFLCFDIECVDVLIGKPESQGDDNKIEDLLEQLRLRQLSLEQIETYAKQEQAAEKKKSLNDANAKAAMQESLTQSAIKISITANEAEAELAKARKDAERLVVTAKAESESAALAGAGQAERVNLVGTAEADVLQKKVMSSGDPRLYAVSIVASALAGSRQPLVPTTMLAGAGNDSQAGGMLGVLMSLMVSDKLGIPVTAKPAAAAPSTGSGDNNLSA
jgi:regulator of protease activity HflC (stomatin/prohibitin superfamily)